jgi:putative membrane protein
LGLFTLIINVFLIYLASAIIPGFEVRGFVPALIFSLVMALFSAILNR